MKLYNLLTPNQIQQANRIVLEGENLLNVINTFDDETGAACCDIEVAYAFRRFYSKIGPYLRKKSLLAENFYNILDLSNAVMNDAMDRVRGTQEYAIISEADGDYKYRACIAAKSNGEYHPVGKYVTFDTKDELQEFIKQRKNCKSKYYA